jgi:dipeptidyl aminopeptidase/acylaminoacyl peptidase
VRRLSTPAFPRNRGSLGVAGGLCVAAILGGAILAQVPAGPWTTSDALRIRSVGEVRISPDGKRIAYTVRSSTRTGRATSQIWIHDAAAGTTSRLGGERDAGLNLAWSPDSQWLAFTGRIDDESGLAVQKMDGAPPLFLARVLGTNHPIPDTGSLIAWSPGSSRIAFVTAVSGPEAADADGDPMVITRYLFKPGASEGLTRFTDNRRLQIMMVDLVSHEPRPLTDDRFINHSLDWSPKGDEILFVSNREADPDRVFNYDIFTVNVARGTVRRLSSTKQAEYHPVWSPGGTAIAMLATKRPLTSSETTMEDTHVWVMKADGTGRREVGAAVDNRQGPPQWSANGAWIGFTVEERGGVRLYRVPAAGGPPEAIAPAAGEQGTVGSWSMSKSGTLAYALTTPGRPAELYVRDGPSPARRVSHLNDDLVSAHKTAPVEPFEFRSADGLDVEAFLTRPIGLSAASKLPMIVVSHGGPHAAAGPEFDLSAQVYAAKGWATLTVNYRGSTGYGQKFADAIFKDQDGAEAADVLAGVDAALARYHWLDSGRLGLEGVSYGGQLTNWIVTRTDRFKAAISTAGISNLVSFNYTAYYHDYLAVEFGSYPHENGLMDLLWERSPLRDVRKVKTPVLILHGENDSDVPITEAEQWYVALKDVGVETVMVRYPREGHGIAEPRHRVDALDRSVAWYEKHFSPPRPVPAAPPVRKK